MSKVTGFKRRRRSTEGSLLKNNGGYRNLHGFGIQESKAGYNRSVYKVATDRLMHLKFKINPHKRYFNALTDP